MADDPRRTTLYLGELSTAVSETTDTLEEFGLSLRGMEEDIADAAAADRRDFSEYAGKANMRQPRVSAAAIPEEPQMPAWATPLAQASPPPSGPPTAPMPAFDVAGSFPQAVPVGGDESDPGIDLSQYQNLDDTSTPVVPDVPLATAQPSGRSRLLPTEGITAALRRLQQEVERASTVGGLRERFEETQKRFEELSQKTADARATLSRMEEWQDGYGKQLALSKELAKQVDAAERERMAAVRAYTKAIEESEREQRQRSRGFARNQRDQAGSPFRDAGGSMGQVAGIIGTVLPAFGGLSRALAGMGQIFGGFGRLQQMSAGGKPPALTDKLGAVGQVVGGASAVSGAVGLRGAGQAAKGGVASMISMAGGGIAGGLSELGGMMSGFVEALNPSAVMVFSQAMRDVSAVIGTALMPVFGVLTQAVRQAGDLLLPVAEQLAPIFGQIAQTVMTMVQPLFQQFGNLMRLAMPFLQMFADGLAAIAPLYQAYMTVVSAVTRAFADFVSSLLGKDYKDGMASFQSAMQKLAANAILAAGALAKFFGQDKFLKALIDATKGGEKKPAGGLGAATGGKVTDFRSFEREQLAAAFTATAGPGEQQKKSEDWLADVSKQLEMFQKDGKSANDFLKQKIEEVKTAILGLPARIAQALAGGSPTFTGATAGSVAGAALNYFIQQRGRDG